MIGPAGPAVTLCIPSFNRADLIGETIDSIIAQTLEEWEAIIVDDGSTDGSLEVIAEYTARDTRVRLMPRARGPKGACTCRNIAVEAARGRYLVFLDTDDLLAPYCLEQRVEALDARPDADFAIFPMWLFKGSPHNADRLWNVDSSVDDLVRLLRLDPVCQGTGTLWRRDAFQRVGMWDERLLLWQDIELHLRAFGTASYVKRFDLPPDVYLRETNASLSRGNYQSREKIESRAEVTRNAVQLLKEIGRRDLLPEVRFFCSSVVLGAAASGNADVAREMERWAVAEKVLTSSDVRRLRLAELYRISRIERLSIASGIRDRILERFVAPSTLGQVLSVSKWS